MIIYGLYFGKKGTLSTPAWCARGSHRGCLDQRRLLSPFQFSCRRLCRVLKLFNENIAEAVQSHQLEDFLGQQWQDICHRAALLLPKSHVRSTGWVHHHRPHCTGLCALQPGSRVPSSAPTRPLLGYPRDSSHLRLSLFSKPLKNNIPPKKGPNPASI